METGFDGDSFCFWKEEIVESEGRGGITGHIFGFH